MAIKYPENTSYNAGATYKNMHNLVLAAQKAAAARLNNTGTTNTNVFRVGEPSPTANITPEQTATVAPYINSGVSLSPAFTPGTTVSQYKNLTNLPYNYELSDAPYQAEGNYLQPSDITEQAKFQSMPETLGGGQYVIEPTKPGQAVKSARGSDWKARELERQGLDPALYQIDHLIPLWAGGSDTLANKEVLDNMEHDTKTNIQSVPLTLLANGLVSQREAMEMALTWRDKAERSDISYPVAGQNGLITLSDAERIARKWEQAPGGLKGFTWKSFLESIPEAGKQIYAKGAEIAQAILPKSAATAAPREFIKGFVSAIPTYNVAMPQLDTNADYNNKAANTTGAVSYFLGALTGNVVAFGALYKIALRGLSKAGVSWAAKELIPITASQKAAEALTKTTSVKGTEELTKENIGQLSRSLTRTGQYIKNVAPKAATLGGVMTVMGQLSPQNPEDSRLTRAIEDFAMGSLVPIGRAKYNVRGYASIAAPALAISFMEGQKPTDAFVNALTLAGMHGIGQLGGIQAKMKSGQKLGGILTSPAEPSPMTGIDSYWAGDTTVTTAPRLSKWATAADKAAQERTIQESAMNLSSKWREVKYGEMLDDIKAGKLKPEWFGLDSTESIRYRKTSKEIELDRQNAVLNRYMQWKAETEQWSNETLKREQSKIAFSGRELFKGGMGKVARKRADLQDMLTYSETMKSPNPNAITVPERIKYLEQNTSEAEKNTAPTIESKNINKNSPLLNAEIPVTGISRRPNIEQMNRVNDSIVKGNTPSTKLPNGNFLVNGWISTEQWKNEPWARVYALVNGKLEDVGSIPKSNRILEFNKNDLKRAGFDPETTEITPALRAKYKMFDPTLDNVRVIKEMNDKNTPVIKITMVYNPEVQAAMENGEHATFFKAIFNDGTWDEPNNKKMKELMIKNLNLTPEQVEVVTQTVNTALDNQPRKTAEATNKIIPVTAPAGEMDRKLNEAIDLVNKNAAPVATVDTRINDLAKFAEEAGVTDLPPKIEAVKTVLTPKETVKPIVTPVETKPVSKIAEENKQAKVITSEKKAVDNAEKGQLTPEVATITTVENKVEPTDTPSIRAEKTGATDFKRIIDGKISGFSKDAKLQIAQKGIGLDSPEAKALIDYQENFRAETLPSKAKKLVADFGGDEDAAFQSMVEKINGDYAKLGFISPLTRIRSSQAFKSLFKRNAQSVPSPTIIFGKKGVDIVQKLPRPANEIDSSLEKFNKENGTSIDMLMTEFDPSFKKKNRHVKLEDLKTEFYKKGYVPFGIAGNSANKIFAIKYEPSILSGYDAKTKVGKPIAEGADEFFNKIIFDILGVSKTVDRNVLNKRLKELSFSEYKPVNKDNVKKRLIVVNFGKDADGLEIVDGASFMHINDMREINVEGGYLQNPDNYLTNKNVIIFKDGADSKNLNVIKNQLFGVKPDSETAKALEKQVQKYIPDYKLQFGDYITSHNNVKISDNILSNFGEGKKNFYIGEFPMSALRAKYNLPKRGTEDYRFSPYLISKNSYADGINDAVAEMVKPAATRFKEAFTSIINAKSSDEAREYFTEYDDIFKGALGEEVYGKTKKMLANGAWGRNGSDISYELNKTMATAYREYVLNGKFLKSGYGQFLPDIGQLGKPVPEGSIVLSKSTIEKLGNPKTVMAARHPHTKRTGMLALKVIDADANGITDLGNSMIINSKNGYNEFYFDTDGDAGVVFAVGKNNGKDFFVPQKIADKAIEIYKKEGGQKPPTLTNYPKKGITYDNMLEIGMNAVEGGRSVGENSTMRSIMQGVIDNNETIGGWTLKPPSKGQTVDQRNQEMFYYFEKMNNASTDAPKKIDLSEELKKYNAENLSDLLRTKYFDPPKGVPPKAAEKRYKNILLNDLRQPFESANDTSATDFNYFVGKLFGYKSKLGSKPGYYQKVAVKRSKPQPIDQMMLTLQKELPQMPPKLSGKEDTAIHNARLDNLDKTIKEKGIVIAPESDSKVKSFIDYFTQYKDNTWKNIEAIQKDPTIEWYDKNVEIKDLKNVTRENITEYYYANIEPSLNQEQKRAISLWLLKSGKANWGNFGPAQEAMANPFQFRFSYIFNDTPEIAKPYYAAELPSGLKFTTKPIVKPIPVQGKPITSKYPSLVKKDTSITNKYPSLKQVKLF